MERWGSPIRYNLPGCIYREVEYHQYWEDITRTSSYAWFMLIYLTILNPIICAANALLTIALLTFLSITYPIKMVRFRLFRAPQAIVLTARDYHASWSVYAAEVIRARLSSLLFLHLRILYQTNGPPPLPEEWDATMLVTVHLSRWS
ncbi:hypothetical protein BDZ91DRAFT_180691 [Kalaharituber pfeilii]|nr:hypothetical protein BDZ91DRAFT_180691 [Kalaharituber pfeilii]